MSDTPDVSFLRDRINDQQVLLADVLPELHAYYRQKHEQHRRDDFDKGALLELLPPEIQELKDLVNRVVKEVRKPPIE
jgi:hypothetical protein